MKAWWCHSTEQYENLKRSIKKEGYWPGYPIVVNSQGIILEGHNRFKACRALRVDLSRHKVIESFMMSFFKRSLLLMLTLNADT